MLFLTFVVRFERGFGQFCSKWVIGIDRKVLLFVRKVHFSATFASKPAPFTGKSYRVPRVEMDRKVAKTRFLTTFRVHFCVRKWLSFSSDLRSPFGPSKNSGFPCFARLAKTPLQTSRKTVFFTVFHWFGMVGPGPVFWFTTF